MTLNWWIIGATAYIFISLLAMATLFLYEIRNVLSNILDQGWESEAERAKHSNELPWQSNDSVYDNTDFRKHKK